VADFHVDDAASRGFQFVCAVLHVHHVEGSMSAMRAARIKFAFGTGDYAAARRKLSGSTGGDARPPAKFGYHAAKQHKNFKSRISHG